MTSAQTQPTTRPDGRRPIHEQWLAPAADDPCSVDWCPQERYKRGLCRPHYARWSRLGAPEAGDKVYHGEPLVWLLEVARYWQTDQCIEWPYRRARFGYGLVRPPKDLGDTTWMAHNIVLELVKGPAPRGDKPFVAMHICENPPCCNPRHLRWGTHKDNARHAHR